LAVLAAKRLVALGAVEAALAGHQPPSARSLKLPVSRLVSIYINSFEHFVVEIIFFYYSFIMSTFFLTFFRNREFCFTTLHI